MYSAWRNTERKGWSSAARRSISRRARPQVEILENRLAPSAGVPAPAILHLPAPAFLLNHLFVNTLPAFPGGSPASAGERLLNSLLSETIYDNVRGNQGVAPVPPLTISAHTAVGVGGYLQADSMAFGGVSRTSFWGAPAENPVEPSDVPVTPGKLKQPAPVPTPPGPGLRRQFVPPTGTRTREGEEKTSVEEKKSAAQRPKLSAAKTSEMRSTAAKPMLANLMPQGSLGYLLVFILIASRRALQRKTWIRSRRGQRDGAACSWLRSESAQVIREPWARRGAALSAPRAPPRIRGPDQYEKKQGRHACLPCFFFWPESANAYCPLSAAGMTAGSAGV